MGLLKGLFELADEIVSIPTDILGITGGSTLESVARQIHNLTYSEQKELLRASKLRFMNDEISASEYSFIKKNVTI